MVDRKSIIVEGKTLEEATKSGLKALDTQIDYVDIEVLEVGKSRFGIFNKNFKVKLTEKTINYEEITNLEAENENGKFEMRMDKDKSNLIIYPPNGLGKTVSIDEIIFELEKNEIKNIDIEKIKSSLKLNKVTSIDIKDLEIKDPIDAKAEVIMSRDNMKVYMKILPPNGGNMITREAIDHILEENHIVYGIDDMRINKMILEKQCNDENIIAEGKEPENGKDGMIKYNFDINIKGKPQITEDGKVDFKEIDIICHVKKGDYLAEKILPTDGIDGMTVTGKELKAKPGKIVHFKKGKNVGESEDGLKLIAEVDGQVKLVNDKVNVLQVYEVNGNVDHATGNIHFAGKVIIRGNVRTGFKIECSEDVEIYGVVEGATIIADGDIILHKGIQGHNTGKLISKKEIICKYMENCYAKANETITADAIMHCKLESNGSIVATGKKGLIVGGEIRARNEVSAKCIGSPMSTVTKLEVGIDPDIKERYESLRKELEELYKNKENVVKAKELLTKISKMTKLPKEKQNMLDKSINTEKHLDQKIESVNMAMMQLQNMLQKLSSGRVNVSSLIYPGVRISIGNSVYYSRDDIVCATITREDGEIKINPYLAK
ncbi:FapA family protein [Marinisporobacter balticus]|uniref:RNA-binding protein KhpB N-terminal domain-containing protein n=1 Tax=Marinisporobacter balticus TaxID=2018667 RepID=A0A4R2L734_9FIRM|nr:FapA family protein [Marinisporobacter balticus]TCO79919.1 hypothetical protein EV214_101153 [Marinisporobacter balticus]